MPPNTADATPEVSARKSCQRSPANSASPRNRSPHRIPPPFELSCANSKRLGDLSTNIFIPPSRNDRSSCHSTRTLSALFSQYRPIRAVHSLHKWFQGPRLLQRKFRVLA